ncbi:MAG: hypothetical protein Q7S55_04450 [Nanoarchaeota archaeon]|nr:hypothetical protein [Nanoarchaeota archaeon]
MDEKKREMLERAGFGKRLIDELAKVDVSGLEEILPELREKTLEHLASKVYSRPEPMPERSWLSDKYQRAVEFFRKYL